MPSVATINNSYDLLAWLGVETYRWSKRSDRTLASRGLAVHIKRTMSASAKSTGLSGTKCLVVGATDPKSIGYTCAVKLVESGADVCIVGRDEAKVASASRSLSAHAYIGGSGDDTCSTKEVSGVVGDLKQPDTMEGVFQQVISTTGWDRLDVLIISVGNGKSEYLGLDPQKADDYRMSFDVAVLSPQFLIDAAVPYLVKSTQRGGGSVVVVGSMAPLVPWPDTAPYNYARSAQNCMVETLAFRHRMDGMRVNAVLPSCIHTGALDLMATKKGKTVEEYAKLRAEAQPTGRNGTPEEVADASLFLASGASSYLTGELMKVDGGLHLSSWFNRPKITKEFVGGTD